MTISCPSRESEKEDRGNWETFCGERNLPSNFLDNLPHERGALAQVAFRARDTGFDFAGGGFLAKPTLGHISKSSFRL